MELIDFDGLFDKKLTGYMKKNGGKRTEKEWENLIPELYEKFGDAFLPKIGCTPRQYYARMNDEQLIGTLCGHLQGGVPVPEFLCAEVEKRRPTERRGKRSGGMPENGGRQSEEPRFAYISRSPREKCG